MKKVKFKKNYPTYKDDILDEKKVIHKKGSLMDGSYEKDAVTDLNDQLANDLKKEGIVEILPKQTNDNIMELLDEINVKLDKLIKDRK